MALNKFTQQILKGLPIALHYQGDHTRDLIYIDDLVDAIMAILEKPPQTPLLHTIFNLGGQRALDLRTMVQLLENELGLSATIQLVPRQPGEIKDNQADASYFISQFGMKPKVDFEVGIKRFVDWYRAYYQV